MVHQQAAATTKMKADEVEIGLRTVYQDIVRSTTVRRATMVIVTTSGTEIMAIDAVVTDPNASRAGAAAASPEVISMATASPTWLLACHSRTHPLG
jgi:hypothetical protein